MHPIAFTGERDAPAKWTAGIKRLLALPAIEPSHRSSLTGPRDNSFTNPAQDCYSD